MEHSCRIPRDPDRVARFLAAGATAELEIGAGKGTFLVERAAAFPDTLFVAVEIRRKSSALMAARAGKRGLANLLVVCDDVRNVFAQDLRGEGLFDRVFIHFPDPWWKKRHEKRALFGDDIIGSSIRVLREGGEFFLQTDIFARARMILGGLSDLPALRNADEGGGFLTASPFAQKSGRELTCNRLGLPIFRMSFRKI